MMKEDNPTSLYNFIEIVAVRVPSALMNFNNKNAATRSSFTLPIINTIRPIRPRAVSVGLGNRGMRMTTTLTRTSRPGGVSVSIDFWSRCPKRCDQEAALLASYCAVACLQMGTSALCCTSSVADRCSGVPC